MLLRFALEIKEQSPEIKKGFTKSTYKNLIQRF